MNINRANPNDGSLPEKQPGDEKVPDPAGSLTGTSFRIWTLDDILAERESLRQPWHVNYYAMYSSIWGGCVRDPLLMQVPADDHVVHRGDGVFETMKCVDGSVYALPQHLARLKSSAQAIHLSPLFSEGALQDIVLKTVVAGGNRNALVRMILSRGPGSFGVNPADCPKTELYIIVYRLPPSFMEMHPEGARAIRSRIAVKPSWFATIKSCNYLPNVLMKREASEAGADFALGFDEEGRLTESATENVGIVTSDLDLVLPEPGRMLEGITMERVAKLAVARPSCGGVRRVCRAAIHEGMLRQASEVLIFGTTPDVTSVVRYEETSIGEGRPGPVQSILHRLLVKDICANPDFRTPAF